MASYEWQAKCTNCGCCWEYDPEEYDDLACHFCNARVDEVQPSPDKHFVLVHGTPWKQVEQDDKRKREAALRKAVELANKKSRS